MTGTLVGAGRFRAVWPGRAVEVRGGPPAPAPRLTAPNEGPAGLWGPPGLWDTSPLGLAFGTFSLGSGRAPLSTGSRNRIPAACPPAQVQGAHPAPTLGSPDGTPQKGRLSFGHQTALTRGGPSRRRLASRVDWLCEPLLAGFRGRDVRFEVISALLKAEAAPPRQARELSAPTGRTAARGHPV